MGDRSVRKRQKTSSRARSIWYLNYRLRRIALREHDKAFVDSVIFGMGLVRIDLHSLECKHVPYRSLFK